MTFTYVIAYKLSILIISNLFHHSWKNLSSCEQTSNYNLLTDTDNKEDSGLHPLYELRDDIDNISVYSCEFGIDNAVALYHSNALLHIRVY